MYNSKEKCKEMARKFKQLCETRGTTPYKVARRAGISTSTVSCFLAGKTMPRMDTMLMLCDELGIPISDFFDERELEDQQTQEEKSILEVYRNLSRQKKQLFHIYLKMLAQYKEE